MDFWKMHGLGNDFVLTDDRDEQLAQPSKLAREACRRHFGIGADGLILVQDSSQADFRMRIFNPDGSEAEMCGNGIRCFARFVWELGLSGKTELEVETPAGIMKPRLMVEGSAVTGVAVDMGEPVLEPPEIPVRHQGSEPLVAHPLEVDGHTFEVTVVSMGNPHCIIPVEDAAAVPLEQIGPQLETHPFFPAHTNVEFVQFLSPEEMTVRVWERGAGATLACGTGASACAVAGVLLGRSHRSTVVHLPGGPLHIQWSAENNRVIMTGPADKVFTGTYRGAQG